MDSYWVLVPGRDDPLLTTARAAYCAGNPSMKDWIFFVWNEE